MNKYLHYYLQLFTVDYNYLHKFTTIYRRRKTHEWRGNKLSRTTVSSMNPTELTTIYKRRKTHKRTGKMLSHERWRGARTHQIWETQKTCSAQIRDEGWLCHRTGSSLGKSGRRVRPSHRGSLLQEKWRWRSIVMIEHPGPKEEMWIWKTWRLAVHIGEKCWLVEKNDCHGLVHRSKKVIVEPVLRVEEASCKGGGAGDRHDRGGGARCTRWGRSSSCFFFFLWNEMRSNRL
jgi:hypothetical protein